MAPANGRHEGRFIRAWHPQPAPRRPQGCGRKRADDQLGLMVPVSRTGDLRRHSAFRGHPRDVAARGVSAVSRRSGSPITSAFRSDDGLRRLLGCVDPDGGNRRRGARRADRPDGGLHGVPQPWRDRQDDRDDRRTSTAAASSSGSARVGRRMSTDQFGIQFEPRVTQFEEALADHSRVCCVRARPMSRARFTRPTTREEPAPGGRGRTAPRS